MNDNSIANGAMNKSNSDVFKRNIDVRNHVEALHYDATMMATRTVKEVFFWLVIVLLAMLTVASITFAAEKKAFYAGKTVTIISWSAGSPTDVAARLYARHLPRFLSGNPEMIVKIVSGAGGVVAANYMYQLAKPDGLTLWINEAPLALTQLSGETGAKFDMLGDTYIGAIEKQSQLVLLSGALPFDTIDKLRTAKQSIRAAARRVGSSDYVGAKAIEALGVPVQIVTGYSSTGEQYTALERGEVHLFIASISSIKSSRPEWLNPKPGIIHHIAALGSHNPNVSHVPNIRDLTPAPGKEGFIKLADFLASAPRRTLSGPPRIPKEITKDLRDSFLKMVEDESFLAEARKLKIEVEPTTGEEVTEILRKFITDPTAKKIAPTLVSK